MNETACLHNSTVKMTFNIADMIIIRIYYLFYLIKKFRFAFRVLYFVEHSFQIAVVKLLWKVASYIDGNLECCYVGENCLPRSSRCSASE